MHITVAICTWNRARLLDQTLADMHKLRIREGLGWEVLVVNNNCTDETDEIISRYAGRLPLRRLFESKQGMSHARNVAVQEAKGDYIVWTDDDVLVDENWLSEYWHGFKRWPNATIFGGPVHPLFEGNPPKWLREAWPRLENAYAIRDFGDKPVPFTQNLVPFGANFAVRMAEQIQYLYDPSLGRKRKEMLGGDETSVVRRMLADGAEGWWVPTARVRHFIPRDRQTTRYLYKYFQGQGRFRSRQLSGSKAVRLFGRPRWLWRQAVEAEIKYRVRRYISSPEVWIEDLITSSYSWGQLCGYVSSPSE